MANSNFKIYDENLVDNATITATTENALFPISNIKDDRRTKVFRSTTNSDSLVFDLQETSSIETVIICANKRTGFGISTATIEFSATSNFSTPIFSTVVSLSTEFSIGLVEFLTVNARFMRLIMTSTLGFCEVSKIYIGKPTALVRSISFNWTFKDEELSQKTRNRYGQLFVDLIARQKTITFALNNFDKEDLDILNGVLDVSGETKPIWIYLGCPEMVNDNRRFIGPVIIDDIPTISNPYFNKYSLTATVRELA